MLRRNVSLWLAVLASTSAAIDVAWAAPGRVVASFNDGWRFSKSDPSGATMPEFDDAAWRRVDVPHDWSIEGPFSPEWASGTGFAPGGIGWYRKRFALDADQKGKRVAIEFDGVYANAQVYVNGFLVGGRPFGFSSFEVDATPYAKFGGGENVVAVRVDHSRYADSRFYTGSGIDRNVRLRLTDPLHVATNGVFVTTPTVSADAATVHVETTIDLGAARGASVQSDVLAADGSVVASATTAAQGDGSPTVAADLNVPRPQRWSLDAPTLYTLRTRVTDGQRGVVDETSTPFGIRTIRFDADSGFSLNDESMKLKGVCIHHDAGCLGAAVPKRVLERRLRSLKAIGVNAIRTSHNPPDPELLDLCDALGLLVMDEALDEFMPAKNKWVAGTNAGVPSRWGYAELFAQWSTTDVGDMVKRDRNHPSVILWSIGNEVDFANDPFSDPVLGNRYKPEFPPASELTRLGKPLVDAVKRFDRTRPVTAALANVPISDAAGFADILDVAGYNYQEPRYVADHAKFPKRILLGSENRHGLADWAAVRDNPFIAGQFLWTGIDYLGESRGWPSRGSGSGLLETCGYKKPAAWFRQSLWSNAPMVYLGTSSPGATTFRAAPNDNNGQGPIAPQPQSQPASRPARRLIEETWNRAAGSTAQVTCYTNCDEVRLTLNDQPIGTKRAADAVDGAITWTLPFQPGTLKAVGFKNGQPTCEFALKTAGAPARITLAIDEKQLRADGLDVAHVNVVVVDADGIRVPNAAVPIAIKVGGPAKLLGVDNGEMSGPVDYASTDQKTARGRALAIVRATTDAGAITLEVSSPGLEPASVKIASDAAKR